MRAAPLFAFGCAFLAAAAGARPAAAGGAGAFWARPHAHGGTRGPAPGRAPHGARSSRGSPVAVRGARPERKPRRTGPAGHFRRRRGPRPQPPTGMEQDDAAEALAELRERRLSARELLQAAAGSGLAAYAVWALLLQPGFRRVPLRLQVPYVGASARQVEHVLSLLRGRPGKTVDLGSGDGRIVLAAHRCGLRPAVGYELNPWLVGLSRLHAWRAGCAGAVCYRREDLWKVSLSDCHNVSVFLAPSVLALLEEKLQAELPAGARVVSGRFPLPTWQPVAVLGEGPDRVWAYDVRGGGPGRPTGSPPAPVPGAPVPRPG